MHPAELKFEVINPLGMRDTFSKTINTAHSVWVFFSPFLGFVVLALLGKLIKTALPNLSCRFVIATFCC